MPKRLSRGSTIFNILIILVFGLAIILALGYHDRAKVAPLVVSIPGLLVMIFLLVKEQRTQAKQDSSDGGKSSRVQEGYAEAGKDKEELNMRSEVTAFLWAILMFVLVYFLGFVVAIPLYLFLYMKVKSKETLKFSLSFAAISSVVLYVFFLQILHMQLYEGLIFEMLG